MDKIENMGTNETNEVNEANGTNETRETTFTSLTPDILEKNKQVYTDALDFAFKNNDIRNIAITGVYGAGKSTVWNTYKNNKSKEKQSKLLSWFSSNPFENVITVCLGKYEDNLGKDSKSNLNSRVESQIINQILSQIKVNNIPLSKYKFKVNISGIKLIGNIFLTILFVTSILGLIFREEFVEFVQNRIKIEWFDVSFVLLLNSALLFLSILKILYNFFKKSTVKLSKVSFKGAEANFSDDNNDETILERDIREIVYLLSSSKSEIVVFEDLDRYDNVDIFIKLKELNFLLNAYLETNGDNKVVRFVYLIKDSLFYSKDRTKFFDFILPIVPVVDSNNSEEYLINLLEVEEKGKNSNEDKSNTSNDNKLDKNILRNISLYIDDMRILRNIVNEYKVYSAVLPASDIQLNENMLFALVTVKNIYPNEFDLLQEEKGFIIDVFKKIKTHRNQIVEKFNQEYNLINSEIDKLEKQIENDKFDVYALHIPNNLRVSNGDSRSWAELLREWSNDPDKYYSIYSSTTNASYRYEEFLNRFISISEEKQKEINLLSDTKQSRINELKEDKIKLKQKITQVQLYNPKELLSDMENKMIDEIFECSDWLEKKNFR